MKATTNQRFAPTLKDKVEDTNIPVDVNDVYELVINGIDAEVEMNDSILYYVCLGV
jgi:formylmethanofuran--tetrahydromethanopterin N-formyltransferase